MDESQKIIYLVTELDPLDDHHEVGVEEQGQRDQVGEEEGEHRDDQGLENIKKLTIYIKNSFPG